MSEPWIGKREDRWTDILPESWQSAINTSPVVNALGRFMQPRPTFDQAARDWQDSLPGNSPIDRIADGRSTLAKEYPKPWSPFAADLMEKGSALSIFLGPAARTANLGALARARQMQAAGVPRENIWKQEGWFQGPDKKWRFEIDDSKTAWQLPKPENMPPGSDMRMYLNDALPHPELMKAHPNMQATRLQYTNPANADPGMSYGKYWGDHDAIGVRATPAADPRSTALHEAQHGVQVREGFARGGNAQSAGNLYDRIAGEVEARAVQARRDLTPEQRQSRPPWLDYDVPESQQIVTRPSDGAMDSARTRNAPAATMKPGPEPDPIIDAWNKGKTIKEIAYETGGDYQAIRKALVDARASGVASPDRARTARAGLTDDMIMNAIREGKSLAQIARDNGQPHQTIVSRAARMRDGGAFDAPDAPPFPKKGIPPTQWPEETLAAMAEQYKSGVSMNEIAAQNGVSTRHIQDILKGRIEPRAGAGNGVRRTDADVARVRELRMAGLPYSKIAEELGTTRNAAISIANRARKRGVSIPALGALTYGAIEAALNGQDTAF